MKQQDLPDMGRIYIPVIFFVASFGCAACQVFFPYSSSNIPPNFKEPENGLQGLSWLKPLQHPPPVFRYQPPPSGFLMPHQVAQGLKQQQGRLILENPPPSLSKLKDEDLSGRIEKAREALASELTPSIAHVFGSILSQRFGVAADDGGENNEGKSDKSDQPNELENHKSSNRSRLRKDAQQDQLPLESAQSSVEHIQEVSQTGSLSNRPPILPSQKQGNAFTLDSNVFSKSSSDNTNSQSSSPSLVTSPFKEPIKAESVIPQSSLADIDLPRGEFIPIGLGNQPKLEQHFHNDEKKFLKLGSTVAVQNDHHPLDSSISSTDSTLIQSHKVSSATNPSQSFADHNTHFETPIYIPSRHSTDDLKGPEDKGVFTSLHPEAVHTEHLTHQHSSDGLRDLSIHTSHSLDKVNSPSLEAGKDHLDFTKTSITTNKNVHDVSSSVSTSLDDHSSFIHAPGPKPTTVVGDHPQVNFEVHPQVTQISPKLPETVNPAVPDAESLTIKSSSGTLPSSLPKAVVPLHQGSPPSPLPPSPPSSPPFTPPGGSTNKFPLTNGNLGSVADPNIYKHTPLITPFNPYTTIFQPQFGNLGGNVGLFGFSPQLSSLNYPFSG